MNYDLASAIRVESDGPVRIELRANLDRFLRRS